MIRALPWTALVVVVGGCKQAPQTHALVPLNNTMCAYEITEKGEQLDIPNKGIAEVDVNSTIRLNMNKTEIKNQLAIVSGVDQAQLTRLQEQISAAKTAIEKQAKAIEALKKLTSSPADWDAAVAEHGKLGEVALDAADKFAQSRGLKNSGEWLDKGLLVGVLDEEKKTVAEYNAHLAQMANARWRVQAQLSTAGRATPLHLPNYDRLPAGTPKPIDKLLPVMTDEVKTQYAMAKELATAIGNLQQSAKQTVGDLVTKIYTKAQDAHSKAKIVEKIVEIEGALKANVNPNDKVKDLAKTIAANAKDLQAQATSCSNAFKRLKIARDGADALIFIQAADDFQRECIKPLLDDGPTGVRAKLGQVTTQIKAVVDDKTAFATVETSIQESLSESMKLWQEFSEIKKIDEIVNTLLEKGRPVAMASNLIVPADIIDRGYTEITDTAIDLTQADRKDNDLVMYEAAVVKDGEAVISGAPQTVKVVRTGWHFNVSAAVLFVGAFNAADSEPLFRPSPAITGAWHYRFSRSSGKATADGLGQFMNVLNLGLGVHVATLTLGKKPSENQAAGAQQIELGLGATGQLFGDLLQGGVGYDLQAERPYYFVGLGLQTATDFGISFPGISMAKTTSAR